MVNDNSDNDKGNTLKVPKTTIRSNSISSNGSAISTDDVEYPMIPTVSTTSNNNNNNNKKKTTTTTRHTANSSINSSANFKTTVEQLSELHDPKSLHAFNSIFDNEYENVFKYLHTDPENGLFSSNINTTTNINSNLEQERIELYGENKLPEKESKSIWILLWEGLQDRTMIILSVAAIVSLALGLYETFGQPDEFDPEGKKIPKVDWVEGVAILIAIFVVIMVGAANDYQKERQFTKLNSKKEDRLVNVLRNNGEQHMISIYEILVGDIVCLQTGDIVPADCILISGQCDVDESALTGESDTIEKYPLQQALLIFNQLNDQSIDITTGSGHLGHSPVQDPMLISGSKLLSGLGTAVVTSVGVNSVHGKTMQALKIDSEVTPLQHRLTKLADNISLFGCLASLLLFIVLFIKFCVNISPGHIYHSLPSSQKGSKFMNIFIVAIALIAVAIPEGLPLAVTLALAFSTTRMSKDGNLVRVLKSCETMGSATCICSDKTGTLTENKMSVVKSFINGKEYDNSTSNNDTTSLSKEISSKLYKNILTNITLNSTAFENNDVSHEQDQEQGQGQGNNHLSRKSLERRNTDSDLVKQVVMTNHEPYLGSKTETALLMFADRFLQMDKLHLYRKHPAKMNLDVHEIVEVIPFESSRKWSGIVVKLLNTDSYRLYIKGASEIVVGKCSYVVDGKQDTTEDQLTSIDASVSAKIGNQINYLAEQALRTISLAHKDFPTSSKWPPKEFQDSKNPSTCNPDLLVDSDTANDNANGNGMVLDAIVGVQDPLRQGVRESVEQCRRAGVTVRMVTGDNLSTAKAIALNASILSEEQKNDPTYSMEGPVFRKLSAEEKWEIIPKLRVLARSSPEDKRILVENLKKMGEIVAVTGDGTNDAPALKLADVGFSMGISGTEVAREASDIILMSDDFSAIVSAIKWGRCVAISIKKFVQFQLTVNFTAVILTFVSAVASKEENSVLTAVQLLWVNLIMDTLAALALATDKPDDNILDRKPKGRNAPLISVAMWKMILIQSGVQIVVTFVLHFKGESFFFGDNPTSHQKAQISSLTFNAFVWMQFFNLIVTRKFDEADGIKNVKDRISMNNLNFFSHFFSNYYFIAIILIIGGFQVLIMYIGGAAFSIARQTGAMWATAMICGLLSLLVGIIVRIIPDEWVSRYFPTKLAHKLEYYLFLGFLHKKKNQDEDLENSSSSETSIEVSK